MRIQDMSSVCVMLSIAMVFTIPAMPALQVVREGVPKEKQDDALHDAAAHDQAKRNLDAQLHLLKRSDHYGRRV